MTNLVPVYQIEQIVGVPRHPTIHYGRAVSSQETFYILHSERCLKQRSDLRDCPFSTALDRGIDPDDWISDKPTVLSFRDGQLFIVEEGVQYDETQ